MARKWTEDDLKRWNEARTSKARAEKVVRFVLKCASVMGRFEGRGKDRRLVIQDVLNFKTGKVTSGLDHVVGEVLKLGRPGYHIRTED